jgi:hypothetical protein
MIVKEKEEKSMKGKLLLFALTGVLIMGSTVSFAADPAVVETKRNTYLEREVRHELLMLPYYNVFDNLAFQVNGGTVILTGEVTRPTLKDDAERVVKRIEGVERVDNQIRILPLSTFDDRIRIATFRAIIQVGVEVLQVERLHGGGVHRSDVSVADVLADDRSILALHQSVVVARRGTWPARSTTC